MTWAGRAKQGTAKRVKRPKTKVFMGWEGNREYEPSKGTLGTSYN